MANPSHDKGNVDELLRIGGVMANVMYNLAQRPGDPVTDRDVAVMDGLRREWDAARRATPPSPSTAPEVDVRHEFELYKSNLGEAANYIGDGLYGNHGVTDQANAFRAGVEVGRRAALASRPAEVDDRLKPIADAGAQLADAQQRRGDRCERLGIAEVDDAGAGPAAQMGAKHPETRMNASSKPLLAVAQEVDDEGLPPLPDRHVELSTFPERKYFTAEQYRQGQRDAVAADRARRAAAGGGQ